MKPFIKYIIGSFCLGAAAFLPAVNVAAEETDLPNYYISPTGAFEKVKLGDLQFIPIREPSSNFPCTENELGTMYFSEEDDNLLICTKNTGWEPFTTAGIMSEVGLVTIEMDDHHIKANTDRFGTYGAGNSDDSKLNFGFRQGSLDVPITALTEYGSDKGTTAVLAEIGPYTGKALRLQAEGHMIIRSEDIYQYPEIALNIEFLKEDKSTVIRRFKRIIANKYFIDEYPWEYRTSFNNMINNCYGLMATVTDEQILPNTNPLGVSWSYGRRMSNPDATDKKEITAFGYAGRKTSSTYNYYHAWRDAGSGAWCTKLHQAGLTSLPAEMPPLPSPLPTCPSAGMVDTVDPMEDLAAGTTALLNVNIGNNSNVGVGTAYFSILNHRKLEVVANTNELCFSQHPLNMAFSLPVITPDVKYIKIWPSLKKSSREYEVRIKRFRVIVSTI